MINDAILTVDPSAYLYQLISVEVQLLVRLCQNGNTPNVSE